MGKMNVSKFAILNVDNGYFWGQELDSSSESNRPNFVSQCHKSKIFERNDTRTVIIYNINYISCMQNPRK